MITFDQILPVVTSTLREHQDITNSVGWLLVNRDLNGRIRLIIPESIESNVVLKDQVDKLVVVLAERLPPHAYPADAMILYEENMDFACRGAATFLLEGFSNVWLTDRLATESNWTKIAPETQGARRIVFFSIKGGVGRSTALASTAWALAQAGKRVLIFDLDVESPGLSSALLPPERQPKYGISDWLVEDLVENSDTIFESMVATSGLSHDGEIYVIPAHGIEPGEYVSKLGRVWMPKIRPDGTREDWSARLQRLINTMETRFKPDVILLDARAGIDEVASSCITDMGANLILLFALEGSQTWTGYRILLKYWLQAGVALDIRERLQIVAALTPEIDRISYFESLRDNAYNIFAESLYDEIAPGDTAVECWHSEPLDSSAPHYPWEIRWHRSLAGLRSLHGRLNTIDSQEVHSIFGPLIEGIEGVLGMGNTNV